MVEKAPILPWVKHIPVGEIHHKVHDGAAMGSIRCRGKLSFDTGKIKGQLSIYLR